MGLYLSYILNKIEKTELRLADLNVKLNILNRLWAERQSCSIGKNRYDEINLKILRTRANITAAQRRLDIYNEKLRNIREKNLEGNR